MAMIYSSTIVVPTVMGTTISFLFCLSSSCILLSFLSRTRWSVIQPGAEALEYNEGVLGAINQETQLNVALLDHGLYSWWLNPPWANVAFLQQYVKDEPLQFRLSIRVPPNRVTLELLNSAAFVHPDSTYIYRWQVQISCWRTVTFAKVSGYQLGVNSHHWRKKEAER